MPAIQKHNGKECFYVSLGSEAQHRVLLSFLVPILDSLENGSKIYDNELRDGKLVLMAE